VRLKYLPKEGDRVEDGLNDFWKGMDLDTFGFFIFWGKFYANRDGGTSQWLFRKFEAFWMLWMLDMIRMEFGFGSA